MIPENVAAEASIMALTFPFSWKYLHGYVLFVRSASDWEFFVMWRSTNTPRFFPSSVISNWWAPSSRQRFLLAIPKGMTLYFPLLNFIPFPVCQHSMLSSTSSNTATPAARPVPPSFVPSANAISSLLPFVPRPVWKILCKSKSTHRPGCDPGILGGEATWGEHGNPGTFYPLFPWCIHSLRWLPYLFHIAIFFMDLLSINLLNKLIHLLYTHV